MINFMQILATHTFMQHALLGGILACIACGIIGPFIVVRKISYIAGGISHTVLAGLGIAYFMGKEPLLGALIAAIIAALIIGWVSLKFKKYEEVIISVLWAAGMAIGLIFITKTPGFNADLMTYLFGNILLISTKELYLLLGLDVIIITSIAILYKRLVAVTFDEEFAKVRGLKVRTYYLLLLCMVAFTVVSLIQIVGLILVLALLTIPAAIARQYTNSLRNMILIAIILGCLLIAIGLGISYQTNLPSGAVIILLAAISFVICGTGLSIVKFFKALNN